jgi:hypothetical protein
MKRVPISFIHGQHLPSALCFGIGFSSVCVRLRLFSGVAVVCVPIHTEVHEEAEYHSLREERLQFRVVIRRLIRNIM